MSFAHERNSGRQGWIACDPPEHTGYDPYGNMTVLNATWNPVSGNVSQYGWRFNFQGGRFDVTTGWYDFRNRDYIPTQGTWAERDPLGFGGGTSDFYGFESANAPSWLDPLGLEVITVEFNAFIKGRPGSVLQDPSPWGYFGYYFHTDGRDFGEPGTSRVRVRMKIDTDTLRVLSLSRPFCNTSSTVFKNRLTGKWGEPDWRQSVPKFKPYRLKRGSRNLIVRMRGISASYPFSSAAPSIDMSITLEFIKRKDGTVDMKITGQHDWFPFYEVVVVRADGTREVPYHYDASLFYTGPGLWNLNNSLEFFGLHNIKPRRLPNPCVKAVGKPAQQ